MEKSEIIEIFNIAHLVEIIYACENNGNVSKIAKELKLKPATIYPYLERLVKLEVLKDEVIKTRGYRHLYHLKEKGTKILKILKELENST